MPIQGGALDVMKSIAIEAAQRRKEIPGLKILALVHDELLCLVPVEYANEARDWLHEIMVRVGTEVLNHGVPEGEEVPVVASTDACVCWSEKE